MRPRLDFVSGQEQPALILVIAHSSRSSDEHLLDSGHRELALFAKDQNIERNFAPAELEKFTVLQNFFDDGFGSRLRIGVVVRQEDKSDSQVLIIVQSMAELGDLFTKE